MKKVLLVAPLWLAVIEFASPAIAADAAHGAQLAKQWCAACHVVSGTSADTATQGPPTFHALARSGKTAEQLRTFLANPHGAMPPLSLSRAEIDDLVGYIQTLR